MNLLFFGNFVSSSFASVTSGKMVKTQLFKTTFIRNFTFRAVYEINVALD